MQEGMTPTHARAILRGSAAVDRIKEHILAAGLKPGDHLPSEGELCEQLGVSRSSVREAMRTLMTLDIVEVRRGIGTFVGDMSLDALVEALVFRGVLSPGDDLQALREVIDVRRALDLAMADRVLSVHRGTDNAELDQLVSEMSQLAEAGQTFPRPDRAFHTEMLRPIGNQLYGQLVGAFWDIHTAVLPRLGLALPADLRQTAHAHGEMLAAARAGDVDRYRRAVVDHYAPLERALASRRNA